MNAFVILFAAIAIGIWVVVAYENYKKKKAACIEEKLDGMFKRGSNDPEGGSAFPLPHRYDWTGMTMRDWYAGRALTGILAANPASNQEYNARLAFEYADAMIKEGYYGAR